jgi:LmbE family N-acetylglucosaminyl deacetylase
VVLVTATDGALGEVPDSLLAEGELLVDRRRRELETSARALGVHRLEMLGYPDSGMAGKASSATVGDWGVGLVMSTSGLDGVHDRSIG